MAEVQQIRELPPKLAFYQPEYIRDAVESSHMEDHFPVGFQSDNLTDPIRFYIRGSEHWIDWEKSYIDISGTIIGTDGGTDSSAKSASAAEMGVINNFFSSLFSSVHVTVNESTVTFNNENYPYLTYIQNLFNYPVDYQNSIGRNIFWKKDTAGKMNDYKSNQANKGAIARKSWVTSENKISGIMKLHSPLFLIKPYLMSFLNVDITLNRVTNHDFLFMSLDGATFKFKIDSIIFRIRKVKLVSSYVESIEQMLFKMGEPITYPLHDSRVFTKTYPGYGTEIIEDNLFHGVMPERIIVGFVNNRAYNGHKQENPFYFQHKNITEIGIFLNGMPHPLPMIQMNFDKHDVHRIFHHMLDAMQSVDPANGVVAINRDEFEQGYTLFHFDMSPDQAGGLNHQSLYNQPANVKLHIKFKQGTPTDTITLVVYYEITSRMLVDSSRQVQVFSK